MSLKGKNIIMVSSPFFNYDQEIKKTLESKGAHVWLYHDRPNEDFLTKTCIRLEPNIIRNKIHRHYVVMVEENKHKDIDYVFFIKCESPLAQDLELLKKSFSKAKFILYMWDAIANIKHYDMKKHYFDHIYSFDDMDVTHHPEMHFLPLFYIDKYKQPVKEHDDYLYDLSFIGTGHSDRPRLLNAIRKQMEESGGTYFIRVYVPSKILLGVKCILNKDFREMYKDGLVITEKMAARDVSKVMDDSKGVIDIQHPKQHGLTMRTIELLGMNKKILTTNETIMNYDFYREENISIIHRDTATLDVSIIDKPYNKIDDSIYERYAIGSWIDQLFEKEG